jgi:hypothetical protein
VHTGWTTLYFVQARGMTLAESNQSFAWIPLLCATLGGFAGGSLAFRAIRAGVPVQRAHARVLVGRHERLPVSRGLIVGTQGSEQTLVQQAQPLPVKGGPVFVEVFLQKVAGIEGEGLEQRRRVVARQGPGTHLLEFLNIDAYTGSQRHLRILRENEAGLRHLSQDRLQRRTQGVDCFVEPVEPGVRVHVRGEDLQQLFPVHLVALGQREQFDHETGGFARNAEGLSFHAVHYGAKGAEQMQLEACHRRLRVRIVMVRADTYCGSDSGQKRVRARIPVARSAPGVVCRPWQGPPAAVRIQLSHHRLVTGR